jgi:hypothetical protein
VNLATPEYLRWSESPITFYWADHPDYVLKSERFPLIVDPLVRMTQITKALMDGGSGLNLLYQHLQRVRVGPGPDQEQPTPVIQSGPGQVVHPACAN